MSCPAVWLTSLLAVLLVDSQLSNKTHERHSVLMMSQLTVGTKRDETSGDEWRRDAHLVGLPLPGIEGG